MTWNEEVDAYLKEHKKEIAALILGMLLGLLFKPLIWLGVAAYLGIKLYNWEKKRRDKKKAEVMQE